MAVAQMHPNLNEIQFNNIATEPSALDNETNFYAQNNNNSKRVVNKGSRRVTFFKNGDKYFGGKSVAITPSKYFSFKERM